MKPDKFRRIKIASKAMLTAAAFIVLFQIQGNATTWNITVQNYTFSPSNVNCSVGDTIKWTWVAGTHTTTSTSVPGGASTWNANINSSTPTFSYKVTVAGTYNYQCNFHFSMGMVGTINASPAGINVINSPAVMKIYPNPVHNQLNLQFSTSLYSGEAEAVITDMAGRIIAKQNMELSARQNIQQVDFSAIAAGTYLLNIYQADNRIMSAKIEKQ